MPSESAKKSRAGFTMIPNALIDNPALCIRDKMILIKLARHGYGKTTVYPSQVRIAKCLGVRRETVKAALDSLIALGPIRAHGKGHQGKQETFTIDLEKAANLTTQSSTNMTDYPAGNLTTQSSGPDDSSGMNKKQSKKNLNNKAAESDAASDAGHPVVPALTPVRQGFACSAQDEEPDDSVGRFSRVEINGRLLTPSGKLPDVEGLEADLAGVLAIGESEPDSRQLEKLADEHGAEYCAFWASWLLRKIAAEFEASRPVENAAGLFRRAVEQRWEVDPSWPEFDESRYLKNHEVHRTGYLADIPF